MAEVELGLYEYTFTIGEQLNDEAIDMAFYLKSDLSEMFSGKSTAESSLSYDTTNGSNHFNLGRGTAAHADGHIYKRVASRRIPEGSRWTAVVDVRDGQKNAPVYIKEWEMPTGVDSPLQASTRKGSHGIYDLAGRRVQNTGRRGVYIINNQDGKSSKVLKR